MKKIFTSRDAAEIRLAKENLQIAADIKADAARAEIKELLNQNPQIGVLCREGKTLYYVYPVGGQYVESSDPYALVAGRQLEGGTYDNV